MDWSLAIDRHRSALLSVLAMLVASVGLDKVAVVTLPRHMRCYLLRILRPAESAARRLIVLVAHVAEESGLAPAPRPFPAAGIPRGDGARLPSFPLLDPLKRFSDSAQNSLAGPRLSIPGVSDPAFAPESSPDDPISAAQLCRRVEALRRVLDNLPAQAKRLARWKARRAKADHGRLSVMRPGWPPGHQARHRHKVDVILSDCHSLARYALEPPDTS